MRKTWKALLGLCGALLVVVGVSSAAGAAGLDDYLPSDSLDFEFPSQVTAGGDITVTGTCTLAEDVTFTIGGQEIGTVTPDDGGDFSATFTVPALDAGSYTIEGTCGDLVASGDIEVLSAGTPTTPTPTTTTGGTPLARTGFEPLPVVTLGAAALVLGGAAVFGSKRRRTSAA